MVLRIVCRSVLQREEKMADQESKEIDILSVGNVITWQVPDLPVLEIRFLKVYYMSSGGISEGLINEYDRARLPKLPGKLVCTSWCLFGKLGCCYEVFWKWKPFVDDSEQELMCCEDFPDANGGEDSNSDDDDDDDDSDDNGEEDLDVDNTGKPVPHTLPFKVLGVACSVERQDHLRRAFDRLKKEKLPVTSTIKPEPDNPRDSTAVAVYIDYGLGSSHVGYIPKELTKFLHPLINDDQIVRVEVGDINFRVAWLRVGYYMKLLITRIGQWEPYVIRASKGVR